MGQICTRSFHQLLQSTFEKYFLDLKSLRDFLEADTGEKSFILFTFHELPKMDFQEKFILSFWERRKPPPKFR